jgi:adenosylcobinamide-GDP ribazoletransferase
MSFRGLRLATQFLTRVPVPAVEQPLPQELSRASAWFPFIGLGVGLLVALVVFVGTRAGTLVGGTLGVVAWVWVTGALHLDGLADLTDALAAAHRDPQKFFSALADPHVGPFGVVSIVLVLTLKMAGLAHLGSRALLAAALIPAWARLGTLAWGRWLAPLKQGHGERFATQLHIGWIVCWTLVLLAASAALAPVLCAAPLVIAAWGGWLQLRLGGATGDCLGAGVEITETVLLMALCFAGSTAAVL